MILELLVVVALILVNGFFVFAEMAVMVARRARLRQMATSSRRARAALQLTGQPDRFLSTVQVWGTVTNLLIGMVGGSLFGQHMGESLQALGLKPELAHSLGLVVSITLITYATVIIGELLPKRAALLAPEAIASQVALPLQAASRLTAPFVWLLSLSLRLLLRLLHLDQTVASRISEEEIRLLLADSHEQGVIDADERRMMNRVMRLGDRNVENLMTPRTRIAWLDSLAPLEENLAVLGETPYSCYPVYRGSDADVLGVLETKTLAIQLARGEAPGALFGNLSEAVFVSETAPALTLLDTFREHDAQLVLVVDEYGDLQGLVTRNDLFGAVLGHGDADETGGNAPVVRRADDSWLLDGSLSSDDLRELLNLSRLPGEGEHDFHTAAGLVMAHYGRIPSPGESFDFNGWRMEVVDVDGARIDKLLLSRLPQAPDGTGARARG